MNFITQCYTDIGIKKNTNQDSALIKIADTDYGKIAFAVVCDGMGGLAKGELASATLIKSFSDWFHTKLPAVIYNGFNKDKIKNQWEEIIYFANQRIMNFGRTKGVNLGTTAVCLLLFLDQYFVLNVGDSRAYEIIDQVRQLTKDQTVVAREIELGNITEAEAKVHAQRSVLLQCVGASNQVIPDFFTGPAAKNSTFLLCSDGFVHEISPDEMYEKFQASILTNETVMKINAKTLVDLNKARNETDNITVSLIRIY